MCVCVCVCVCARVYVYIGRYIIIRNSKRQFLPTFLRHSYVSLTLRKSYTELNFLGYSATYSVRNQTATCFVPISCFSYSTSKTEAVCSSEMLVNFQRSVSFCSSETIHNHGCQNSNLNNVTCNKS
jgi:hypothetical protein